MTNMPAATIIGFTDCEASEDMRHTLMALMLDYIAIRYGRGEITKGTCTSFRESLTNLADYLGHARPVSRIKRRDIETWLGSMNVAPATQRLRLSTAKGFFQWATLERYASTDPTLGIRGPKRPRTVPRGLTDEDIARVFVAARDQRQRLLLTLMLEEGLRAIEVSRLQLGDLDIVGRTMTVTGKGGHSRVLPLTDQTMLVLQDYLQERGRKSGSLLLSYQRSYANPGDGISPTYVAKLASDAFGRAGVDESGHSLRHTFAHSLIDAGASLRDVQGALGHVSIMTTQVYLPLTGVKELRNYMGKRPKEAIA